MVMINVVVFDADETLIDLQPAIGIALDHVVSRVREHHPASKLRKEDLQAGWGEVFGEDPGAPVPWIREESLRRILIRHGYTDLHLQMLTEFFEVRYAHSVPFDDALATLAVLRADYLLGYATNGNSFADRCGLGGEFAFELYAHRGGLPKKPAIEFFQAVAAAADAQADSIVYVGDNFDHDVVAAALAGMRTVWVNRAGGALPQGATVRPDAVIGCLADLPATLAKLTGDHVVDHV